MGNSLRKTYGPAIVYKSLLRFCSDFVSTAPAPLIYEAWDSRNNEAELPKADLFGISGWTYRDDEALLFVTCGLTLSTVDDVNLMREIALLDYLHTKIGTNEAIAVLDGSGAVVNQLVSQHFQIMPTGQSNLRNYRTAAIELSLTRAM